MVSAVPGIVYCFSHQDLPFPINIPLPILTCPKLNPDVFYENISLILSYLINLAAVNGSFSKARLILKLILGKGV
jgi:hypothetical protein